MKDDLYLRNREESHLKKMYEYSENYEFFYT